LKASNIEKNFSKIVKQLEIDNAENELKENPYKGFELVKSQLEKYGLDRVRAYDQISMYNYGADVGQKNNAVIYKNGEFTLHVIKNRASKKLGLEAFNTVQLYDENMKNITG